MSFFSTNEQRVRVCNALTFWIRNKRLWNIGAVNVPAEARFLLRAPISTGERTMLKFAWQVWRIGSMPAPGTRLDVSALFHDLDDKNTRLIGSLLVALADPAHDAIEIWLEKNEGT